MQCYASVMQDNRITALFFIFGMEDLQVGYRSLQQIEQLLQGYWNEGFDHFDIPKLTATSHILLKFSKNSSSRKTLCLTWFYFYAKTISMNEFISGFISGAEDFRSRRFYSCLYCFQRVIPTKLTRKWWDSEFIPRICKIFEFSQDSFVTS